MSLCFLRVRRIRLLVLAVVGALVSLLPIAAMAHPLGNFTVNRYSRIEPAANQVSVVYIIDMAEIPTFQDRQTMDTNGDGALSQAEIDTARVALVAQVGGQIALRIDGQPVVLQPEKSSLTFPVGQGGLPTLRLETRFSTAIESASGLRSLDYTDSNFADRIGWSEVIVRPAPGVGLRDANVPQKDISNELRTYPADMLQTPSAVNSAHLTFALGAANTASESAKKPSNTNYPQVDKPVDNFAALISTQIDGPWGLLLALVAACGLGAAHALAPGHGKSIAAAYLVGARGNAWHALFLGLTTTITHTAGVFALGIITLLVSRFILPEQLYPWLAVASGFLVFLLGIGLLRVRWQGWRSRPGTASGSAIHNHGFGGAHSHAPGEDMALTHRSSTRNLLLLGISGGIIPCPSALVVLLGAIALGRVGLGLILILAFSFGLAGVLTLTGLLLVYARRLFERIPMRGPLFRALPLASALVVVLIGAGMTAQALLAVTR